MRLASISKALTIGTVALFLISCGGDNDSCTTCTKEANGTSEDCAIEVCDNSFSTNNSPACAGVETLLNAASDKETRVNALKSVGYTCN